MTSNYPRLECFCLGCPAHQSPVQTHSIGGASCVCAALDLSTVVLKSSCLSIGEALTVFAQGSTAACRHSCRAAKDCNAWIYCWRPGGCDDGHEYHQEWYPYQVKPCIGRIYEDMSAKSPNRCCNPSPLSHDTVRRTVHLLRLETIIYISYPMLLCRRKPTGQSSH